MSQTDSVQTRYRYTNDVLAGLLVLTQIGLVAWFAYQGSDIPLWLASVAALSMLTAVVWAFGAGAFAAARDAINPQQE